MAMTEAQAQAKLQELYEMDQEVPDTTDADYLTRRALLNTAIDAWDKEDLEWAELYTTLTAAADGTKTTTASTSAYSCPTDFRRPLGYLRVVTGTTSTYYRRLELAQVQLYANDSSEYFYYVTGNPSAGYKVDIHPTPTDSGLTIDYDYYKVPTALTATTSKLEMSDPYYAIYFVLWKMFSNDGDPEQAQVAAAEMGNRLNLMKLQNLQIGSFQPETGLPDPYWDMEGAAFGK